jgi:nicotinamidase-related amidase
MPLTTLDPNTALIVIDLQQGIANGNFIHPIADIIAQTRTLLDVFRANNLPVVLVNVASGTNRQVSSLKLFSNGAER